MAFANKARVGFEGKWKEVRAQREERLLEEKKRAQEAKDQSQTERNRAQRRMNALCEFGSVGKSFCATLESNDRAGTLLIDQHNYPL